MKNGIQLFQAEITNLKKRGYGQAQLVDAGEYTGERVFFHHNECVENTPRGRQFILSCFGTGMTDNKLSIGDRIQVTVDLDVTPEPGKYRRAKSWVLPVLEPAVPV